MSEQVLAKYLQAFEKLKRQASKEFGKAPHKPILLLALLDELERGAFADGLITPSPELVVRFGQYWDALVPGTHWQERMQYPFRYLYQEGFWHFVRGGAGVGLDPERIYSVSVGQAPFANCKP